jgi:putative endonuclease
LAVFETVAKVSRFLHYTMSNSKQHIETGSRGEDLAEEYLLKKGFKILERNFRFKRSEIDLIGEKDGCIVFFEVKTRKNGIYGNPEEAVNAKKLNKIKEAAEEYLYQLDWQGNVRFDILSILLGKSNSIEHLRDVDF